MDPVVEDYLRGVAGPEVDRRAKLAQLETDISRLEARLEMARATYSSLAMEQSEPAAWAAWQLLKAEGLA